MKCLIGVDAGGTKTTATLYELDGTPLATTRSGPANAALSVEDALAHVQESILSCMEQARMVQERVQCLFIGIGMAGIDTPQMPDAIQATLMEALGLPCKVITDAQLAFEAAHQGGDGILLIAGTGSIAYGRKGSLQLRCGGWGHLLGDEGSGYHIAVSAIREVLSRIDDGEPEPPLSMALQTAWGCRHLRGIVDKIYQVGKAEVASLAPVVTALADEGDIMAQCLLHDAGNTLAKMIIRLQKRLMLTHPAIALSGSIPNKDPWVRKGLLKELTTFIPGAHLLEAHEPTRGVLALYSRWKEES